MSNHRLSEGFCDFSQIYAIKSGYKSALHQATIYSERGKLSSNPPIQGIARPLKIQAGYNIFRAGVPRLSSMLTASVQFLKKLGYLACTRCGGGVHPPAPECVTGSDGLNTRLPELHLSSPNLPRGACRGARGAGAHGSGKEIVGGVRGMRARPHRKAWPVGW